MEVSITTLRSALSRWIHQVRAGDEVIVTDRGAPVARLVGVDTVPLMERLVRDGLLSAAGTGPRPVATGATRVAASGPVAGLVAEGA